MTAEQKVRFLTSQAELIERELGTNSLFFYPPFHNFILQTTFTKKQLYRKESPAKRWRRNDNWKRRFAI